MKRLILINTLLIVIVIKVPIPVIETAKNEISQATEEVKQEVKQKVTSRSTTERKPINKLTINSDLRTKSNLSAKEFDKMLKGTNLYGLGKAFEIAEKQTGVNGLYLIGLASLESNNGNSRFAKERNNLFGWEAYDRNPNNAKHFKSKEDCILYVANKLKTNYLTKNGKYFNGYTAKGIDKKYCSDPYHADKIIKIVNKLEKKI